MDATLSRWAPIAGILFAVMLIVGLVLIGDVPDPDASDDEIIKYLDDGGNHTRNIIGYYLWAVAAVAFLWFASGLRSTLRRAEGDSSTLSTLGFGGAAVFAAMLLASGAALAAVAGAIEFGNAPAPAPDFVRMLPQLGWGLLLIGGGFAAIAFILSSSLSIMRTGVLPQWLAWLGFAASVILVFSAIFLPMIAAPIWVVAASAAMLMGTGPERAVAAA